MSRRLALVAAVCSALLVVVAPVGRPASAVGTGFDDGAGHEWRQLVDTTGVTWTELAAVCPRDGVSPCSGNAGGHDVTGWVWATAAQVVAFMGQYAPDLLTANPPSVGGPEYLFEGLAFLDVMRPTFFFSGYPTTVGFTSGWTSSTDVTGAPMVGSAGYEYPIFNGSLGVGAGTNPDTPSSFTGAWLWRTAGLDYTPPVITSNVVGTLGSNGWYRSDVSLTWNIADESPIDSTVGCQSLAITSDVDSVTSSCQATSLGGTSSASTAVKRDATAPAVTCTTPKPVFVLGQSGASVTATVSDAGSGPMVSTVSAPANTSTVGSFTARVRGSDLAGNTASRACSYKVVIPACRGLTPTIVGTGGNDNINGTAGRDIIQALGGADTVTGGGGNDVICGGAGNDSLDGGGGNDTIDGGADLDSLRGSNGQDTCISGEIRNSSCEVITA